MFLALGTGGGTRTVQQKQHNSLFVRCRMYFWPYGALTQCNFYFHLHYACWKMFCRVFRRGAPASRAVETHCGDEGLRLTQVTLNLE